MANILIVDDEAMNRDLLVALLAPRGHHLIEAASGEAALSEVKRTAVDLVVLDVLMPGGIDGLEVTRRLRQLPSSEFLPIVLVTALNDHASKIEGLSAGADEFLSKPIDGRELQVRTSNLLRLRERELALQGQNSELMELHRFREELSSLLVHDLKNPMAAVMGNLALLRSDRLDPQQLETVDDAVRASERVVRLLQNLLDVASQEAGRLQLRRGPIELADLLGGVADQRRQAAQVTRVEIICHVDPELRVEGDADILLRAAENILDNALRHTPAGGRIRLMARAVPAGKVQLRFGNTGKALPEQARHLIFEKFGRVEAGVGRMNLGLGLYFCRLAAEAHGGRIWVEETPTYATEMVIELPLEPQK